MRFSRVTFVFLAASCALIAGAMPARAQAARTTTQNAMKSMPCPTGDASCGNGMPADTTPAPPINGQDANTSAQNNNDGMGNPNQVIEDAPAGDVDAGVAADVQQMNDIANAPHHDMNQPK